jgi:hypothetical protein
MNKFSPNKMGPSKDGFKKVQIIKTTKDDNKPIDYNKIRQFDDRFLEMQIKFMKPKNSTFNNNL